jgi:uncharacterized membrane protein YhfC
MSPTSLLLRILNVTLMIGIPLFLVLWLTRKGDDGFRPIWIGAAGFILSQMGHIPFNQFALLPGLKNLGIQLNAPSSLDLVLLGIAVGLSAGVFEEVTRYLIFRYWLKKDRHTWLPLKYGIGHGGIEAILLGFLALAVLAQVLVMGGEGADLPYPPDQVESIRSQIAAYWEVPWEYTLLGAWERITALAFHVGASLLVYKSLRRKQSHWLVVAILGHSVLNAAAVILAQQVNLILLEAVLFLFAAGWLSWCWSQRIVEQTPQEREGFQSYLVGSSAPQVTPEQLDETRYDQG